MLKISRRELQVFRELQSSPFELGGKIVLNRKGVSKTELVNGSRQNVRVDQIPKGLLWFHTHPNIPLVKPGETAFGNVFKQLNKTKGKDFSVDIIVQPISDDDLLAMTAAIKQEKTCVMMVFTPEGVYLMSEGTRKVSCPYKRKSPKSKSKKRKGLKKKGSKRKLSGIVIKGERANISTVSKISNLPNINNPKHKKDLTKRAREFLRKRDDTVLDAQELLIPKLNKAKAMKTKHTLLKRFQARMGHAVSKVAGKIYPEIKVQFFTWNVPSIKIKQSLCRIPND